MPDIEAVFCDLGGVVWQPNVALTKAALERVGVEADDATLDRAAYSYNLCARDDHDHVETLWDVVDLVPGARSLGPQ